MGSAGASEAVTASRRTVLLASAGVIAAAAGCGSSDDDPDPADANTQPDDATDDQNEPSDSPADSTADPTPTDEAGDETGAEPDAEPDGEVLGSVGDVPVGGGTVYSDEQVVVVQPAEGEFKAYSAVCTHQGCPIESVADGEIVCSLTCGHGSRFTIADGSVATGPASQPLPEVSISVDGDTILVS
jgi:Rieske Fe-S protein